MTQSPMEAFYRDRYTRIGSRRPEDEGTFRERTAVGLEALGPVPLRVLDFGCGSGPSSKVFAAAGHTVTGVDISESAIKRAREEVPGVSFHTVTTESSLPFPDAAFDACFSTEVIEHLFDVTGFLREAHRVLVPGGRLIMTTPYHGRAKNVLLALFNFEKHFDPRWGHIRFFTQRSMRMVLEAAGFTIERFSGVGRTWPVWKSMVVVARANK